ncbi:DUF3772 domain-containing protein [Coralliovum pocilloporae]|uniref:DUF3772 domain-containing protein n=1 Tax=Coralliovum pocilloporae TaxID=3066369 RepID=UPI003306AD0A
MTVRSYRAGLLALLIGLASMVLTSLSGFSDEHLSSLEAWQGRLDRFEMSLTSEDLGDTGLELARKQILKIASDAKALREAQIPQQEQLRARIAELEPEKPSDNEGVEQAESDAVIAQRKDLQEQLAVFDGVSKQASVIEVRTEQLLAIVSEKRTDLFTRALFTRETSALNPELWWFVLERTPDAIGSLFNTLAGWLVTLIENAQKSAPQLIGLVLVAGLLIASFGRRFLVRLASRSSRAEPGSLFEKRMAAAGTVFINTIVPVIGLGLIIFTLNSMELMPRHIERLMKSLTGAIVLITMTQGLARAFLAPLRPAWRLVDIDSLNAHKAFWLIVSMAIVQGVFIVLSEVRDVLILPLRFTIALSALHGVLMPTLAFLLARTMIANLRRQDAVQGKDAGGETRGPVLWRWMLPLGWMASVIAIAATIIGYVPLGSFIATQIFGIGIILSILVLLLSAAEELFSTGFQSDAPVGRILTRTIGLSESRAALLAVVLSGFTKLLLLLLAFMLVAAPWGFESDEIFASLTSVLSGFEVGNIRLSPALIATAVALFLVVLVATKSIQRWLQNRFLPKTRMDVGLQHSITTGLGYIGVIVAVMVGFSHAGLDLSNIALVAGALSVGIGFGLQSIVNNFVSGLILLAERPIKVGDWIVVGGTHGTVKRINVRATEIETFDRASMIVPNSDLISGTVTNYVHGNTMGRITVPVGVSYDSDPDQVREILFECARAHDMVLSYPEPQVYFIGFGVSSLDFELRCFLEDIGYVMVVSSDLRFDIMHRFREEGIEMPFPQRDIHLRDVDRLAALIKGEADPADGKKSDKSAASIAKRPQRAQRDMPDATGPDADGR